MPYVRRRSLGAIPAATVGGNILIGPAGQIINQAGNLLDAGGALLHQVESFFGLTSSDPTRDAQRIARLNQAYTLAAQNNPTPQPNLDNLSGRAYIEQIAADAPVAGGGTAAGSTVARNYARALLLRLDNPMGVVTAPIAGLGISPLTLGLVAVGAFLLFRRRRAA